MEYAKMENGKLAKCVIFPSGAAILNKRFIRNPTESDILAAGYLPIQETDEPETREGFVKSSKWVQTDTAIVRKWTVKRDMRPLSQSAVTNMLIAQQINTLTVDDNTALRMKKFYPTFEDIVGKKVNKGFKFTNGDKLWSVEQPELTIQKHYPPGEGMESLYTEVNETHEGTIDDAIPYNGNMTLEKGKYYAEGEIIYHCYWDTGIPVHNPLAELVGIYVGKYETGNHL